MITEAAVRDALAKVIDPALGHDLISYRMVRSIEVQGDDALIRIELPTHAYPVAQRRDLVVKVEQAVKDDAEAAANPEAATSYSSGGPSTSSSSSSSTGSSSSSSDSGASQGGGTLASDEALAALREKLTGG